MDSWPDGCKNKDLGLKKKIVMLVKTLESPLDFKEITPVNHGGN